ncbi:hypothetical protein [Mannheimia haemolytica]|nr:hypothetical protein [Mannheimia haemolytica]
MAGATGFLEALAITAYHQQLTATPLLVNDDLLSEINKLPHPQRTNPFIDRHGNLERAKTILAGLFMVLTNADKWQLFI